MVSRCDRWILAILHNLGFATRKPYKPLVPENYLLRVTSSGLPLYCHCEPSEAQLRGYEASPKQSQRLGDCFAPLAMTIELLIKGMTNPDFV